MALIDHHLVVRQAHLGLVAASLTLFALRGAGVLLGRRWPMATVLRIMVVLVDTALLSAGVLLWVMLGLSPARDTWLGVKLGLLVVYVLLGTWALKRARTPASRAGFLAAACVCAGAMLSVAWSRWPSGG